MAKDYVWLTEDQMRDYKDSKECFGKSIKKGGYDPKDSNCSKKNCVDGREECIALSKGGVAILIGTKPELVSSKGEPVVEDTPEVTQKWTRETVLDLVKSVIVERGDTPEVVSSATRDKVFVETEDIFIVTKKALRVHRLQDGSKLGVSEEYWKEDNKGIAVEYEDSLDFRAIVEKALERLYIESLPQTEEKKVKTDLFDTTVPEKEVEKEAPVEEPEEEPKAVLAEEPTEEPEEEYETDKPLDVGVDIEYNIKPSKAPSLDLGEVIKVLKITSYSNGYNSVEVISQASVDDILDSVKGIVG